MKALLCPISSQRVKHSVVRLTGLLMAMLLMLFVLTGNPFFLGLCVLDYAIRAFTPLAHSPFSWLADRVARALKLTEARIDKAPKIFAARVGLLFALTALLLALFPPAATGAGSMAALVALTLMGFALLESLFDLCVGCLVYTYLIFPRLGNQS